MKVKSLLIAITIFSGCRGITPQNSGIAVELGTLVVDGSSVGMVEYLEDKDQPEEELQVTAIPLMVIVRNKSNQLYPIWHESFELSARQLFFEIRTEGSNEVLNIHRVPRQNYSETVNPYNISPGQLGVIPVSFSVLKWSVPKNIHAGDWVHIRACVDGIYSEWIRAKYRVQICGFFEETDPMRRSPLTVKEIVSPGEL